MNRLGNYIKQERKKLGLTQEEFAMRSGLGLRDKVNQALAMFGMEAMPVKKEK